MGPSPTPFVSTDATLFVVKPVLKTREGHTICALHDNPHTADNIVQTARKHKGNHAFRAVAVEHSMLPLSAMGATRMTCGTIKPYQDGTELLCPSTGSTPIRPASNMGWELGLHPH